MLALSLLFTSCVDEPEAPELKLEESGQIQQVKSWFEANKTKLRLPEKGNNLRTGSQELVLPFFEKEPDWDKFHHYYFPDGREVFEMNLTNSQIFFPKEDNSENHDEVAKRVIQNILFVKHPTENRFDPLIVRYFPTDESSKRDFKDFNYQQIDEKWSGSVDIFTYDEHYFIGFEIDAGQVLGTRKMEVIPNGQRKSFSKENLDYKCTIVEIETTWVQFTYVKETNTWYVQTLSPTSSTSYYCPMESGIDSSNTPGTTYTYPDYTTSLGGGASGYNPPDVPMPKLTIYIDSSISNNSRVSCIVNKLSMTAFVKGLANFTKSEDINRNSVIKLGPLFGAYGQTRYTNNTYEITLNSNDLTRPDLLIARTILHELVHAEIMATLNSNGQTPLDDNFAYNFDKFINLFYGSNMQTNDPEPYFNPNADLHHKYMAEQLLSQMGAALMDIHRNYFPEDFQSLNNYVKSQGIYPKGVSVDFYMNLFWQGLEGTLAFNQMKSITTTPPLKSPFQLYTQAKDISLLLTKPCGN